MSDLNSIQILISQISAVRMQYEKIAELTGEKFNIFNILGLSTNEVRTHSAFLGEILNIKGSHCLNDLYLKEFCRIFEIENFECSNAFLEIEKSTGNISEDRKEGGYIDIFISDKNNNAIIIENKIYAGDQENQLLRYSNFGKKYYKSVYLFYLTLDGREPSDFSKNGLEKDSYICISYSKDIKNWLEVCKEKSVNQPIIRETLTQYINLINLLTGQSTNIVMNNEIVNKIINDKDNLKTFFEIHKSNLISDVRRKMILNFKQQLIEIAAELNLDLEFTENFGFDKETEFSFHFPNSKTGYYFSFGFCYYFSRLVYGIYNNTQPYNNEHIILISNRLGNGLGWSNYLWVKDFENNLSEWNNVEPWIAIIDNSLKTNIKEKVNILIQSLKGIDE